MQYIITQNEKYYNRNRNESLRKHGGGHFTPFGDSRLSIFRIEKQ